MKVVHISASITGGARTAAFRIHKALLKNGIDSNFICLDPSSIKTSTLRHSLYKQQVDKINLLDKLNEKIKWRLKHHFNIKIKSKKEDLINRFQELSPTLKCEIATLPFSDSNILENPHVQNADIIHLHWVAEVLDYFTFFKENTKPVVWTLHDMNPLQGIFHYKEDEERNKMLASQVDEKVKKFKKNCIKNAKARISIVTPSHWLLNVAMNSKVFKNLKVSHILYPLDMEIFLATANGSLKDSLNFPKDHTIFLFVAQATDNYRKGFDLLAGALKYLNQENITLMVIGKSQDLNIAGLNILMLDEINDERTLSNYYCIADAFILPSREDNLPNVMLESMACGTPVISFNIGGMSEIISNRYNGLKANRTEAEALADVLKDFIKSKDNFNREVIRDFALKNFSENLIAQKYKEVYTNLLKS